MHTIINKSHDGDQQVITVKNKGNGEEFTYFECEIDEIRDVELRKFLQVNV